MGRARPYALDFCPTRPGIFFSGMPILGYDPRDYPALVANRRGAAALSITSRLETISFWHMVGNKMLTRLPTLSH